MATRLAQVVFTVTQFPSVTGVEFQLDGVNTVVFGAGGLVLDRPASRASFPDLTPAILVENPTPDDAILSPLLVTGVANTFEGETSFRLLDASGRTLAEAQGTGGTMGSWGRFTASLRFNAGDAAGSTGALVGYDHSPKDGSPVDVVKIPIRFSP